MPEMTLPRALLPLVQKPKRFKIIIGGRGSGKSQSVGDICLMDAQTKGIRTACFREFQVSMDDSVHALLSAEIERLDLQGFKVQSTAIQYAGHDAFKFRGLARNPEGIKSMHGFKRFWVEEAQTISFDSLKALTPTLRSEDSEIWMTGNPRHSSDVFSQRFIKPFEKQLRRDRYYEDDLHLIIWVNYDDNPFFPDVLEQERAYDQSNLSTALYRHIWLGEYYDEVEDSIIPVEWFDAAIDAHEKLGFKPEGAIIASHDPSDEGGDTKGLAIRRGSVVLQVMEKTTGDSNVGMDWALEEARKAGADWFVWDCDGMGISLKRQVEQALSGTKMQWWMFRGSESPDDADSIYASDKDQHKTNRDTFYNKRAQYWWKLRERFEATWRAVEQKKYINPDEMISLSSNMESLDQLRAEVCRIPLKRNNNGKIQIMSKLEMAKKPYQLPSPNMGDSLMMSMYSPKAIMNQVATIKFAGWGGR
jgi:phage terminase large subunit